MEFPPPDLPAALVARFRMDQLLASGYFGAAWRARDLPSDRAVTLKVLHAHTLKDATQIARFRRAAELASRMKHHAVVPVLAYGIENDTPWIVYEMIEGRSLRQAMDAGPFAMRRAVTIAFELACALACGLASGIRHGGVKPENVLYRDQPMVLRRGEPEVLLADFGVAPWTGERVETMSGVISGTPLYMPPEVLRGAPPGFAADVYALGVILHELLAGVPPVEGASSQEILRSQARSLPPRLSERLPNAPPALEKLVARALATDPAERFWDGAALAERLGLILREEPLGDGTG